MIRYLRLAIIAVFAFLLGSCATVVRTLPAPDAAIYQRAQVQGFHYIRAWGDEKLPFMDRIIEEYRGYIRINPALKRRSDILALSGGGADGAFGAGFLKGWTSRGDRPAFSMVTGVSTGALIAPFAYLGPKYDDVIKRFYTQTSTESILRPNPIGALFGASGLANNGPLKQIIKEEVNDRLIKEIAREYRRGRMLLIGTTNLDAQRQVIWDIGRIAVSGHPNSVSLIRQILLASVSIPGVFSPVMIDVVIDGQHYQELHVDGGVTQGVFAYPISISAVQFYKQLRIKPKKTLWIILNGKLKVDYKTVALNLPEIAGRSIHTLKKYQGAGELRALELLSQRDGYRFRLTSIPESFDKQAKELFDQTYMNALYQRGYQAGQSGKAWCYGLGDQFTLKPGGD